MRGLSLVGALDLKARIVIFALALFLCNVWVTAYYFGQEARNEFQNALAAQQFRNVENVASSIDEAVMLRVNSLADAASLIKPEWMADQDRLHGFLAGQQPLHRFFGTGMSVISREGVGLVDLPALQGREGASFAETDFFRAVMATGKPVVGKPIVSRFMNKPIIPIAAPIMSSTNEVIGVLVGGNQVSGSEFFSELSPKKLRTNGDLHVISPRDHLIVASSDPGRIMQPDPAPGVNMMYDRYRQGYEGSGVEVDSLGVENLSSAKIVQGTGWIVIGTLPTSIAFEPIASLQRKIYKDAALASLLIVLLLWLFLHRQLSPLNRSAQLIEEMAHGRAPLRPLPLEGSREIRRLLGSFNQLQQHIGEQAQSLRESEEQMRLAASVFEGTSEAILISSPENRILSVNHAFCTMTGYDESELVGKDPRLQKSGRHDAAYYQAMWSSLQNTGQWQGEIWNRRKNGEIYPERLNISTLYDENGSVLRYISLSADITKQKQAEAVIWQQANHDLLTNLPNRRLLHERMDQALEKSRRDGQFLAVLHVDLDHFKEVNDTLGHALGDQMIVEVAKRISSCVIADSDTVAHVGGDEFVIVLSALAASSPRVEQVAEAILRTIAEPFGLGSETVFISASVGITLYPGDTENVAGLLKNADQAMDAAKSQGHNRFCYFTASMQRAAQTRMQLANDLRGALADHQFEVYYQPIVDLITGSMTKAEALLRWLHPERGMIMPEQFIPIAEETGLISEIGDWVFKEAAQMAKRLCSQCEFSVAGGCSRPGATDASSESCLYQVTVNKSPRQFLTGNTDKTWIDYLRANDVSCGSITIEITEGLLLDQNPEVMEKLLAFRDAGIQVALDDFGTGYSAMAYLKKFDIDYLKIDRSFVREMVTDASDRAIAEAIIAMAHKLGLKVVAEGVETIEQRDLLTAAGCDYGQGNFFARPMPAARLEALIAQAASLPQAQLDTARAPS
jgi:diguanylate cyclase (GGDEF)-like protein/PAS domain S-box-containing protein